MVDLLSLTKGVKLMGLNIVHVNEWLGVIHPIMVASGVGNY
jgi:hypothetical protein